MPLTVSTGTGYVLHFLKHWRTPHEEAGRLLRITLAWYQYQAGVSYPVLTNPTTDLSYTQSNFIPAVRNYLCKIQGSIKVDKPYIYPKLRSNDKSIMEIAQELDLTSIQMKRLNQVRIHLGVMWLSEISTIQGTRIRSHITDFKKQEIE